MYDTIFHLGMGMLGGMVMSFLVLKYTKFL